MNRRLYRGDIIRTQDGGLQQIFEDQDGSTVLSQTSTADVDSNYELVDRNLFVGDSVWHNPSSEFCVVTRVRKIFELKPEQGETITGVDDQHLEKITPIDVLDFVIFQDYIGCVERIPSVTLNAVFADGSVCRLKPNGQWRNFHPGQVINLDQGFEVIRQWPSSKELTGTAIISDVIIESVSVDWYARIRGLEPRPLQLQRPNQLSPIRLVENLPSLHNRVFYPRVDTATSGTAEISNDDDWARAVRSGYRDSLVVTGTQTYVTLMSESGREWESVKAVDLIPEENYGGWMIGKFVLSNVTGNCGFLKTLNSRERSAVVHWFGKEDEENVSLYDLDLDPEYNFSYDSMVIRKDYRPDVDSMIGIVVSLVNGSIRVKWADGEISLVDRDDIYIVNCGMESPEESETSDSNCINSVENSSEVDYVSSEELELAAGPGPLPIFGSAKCPTDHKFYGLGSKEISARLHKGILKEWDLLKQTLPQGIYVRVYEDQLDLLRGMVVGVEGTPYHNCLFFFDIHFPPEYPFEAPNVNYNFMSVDGKKINPNFLEEGKICLSLLGTWHAKENEATWTSESTICQVLISLQSLVLKANPWFNEEGFELKKNTAPGEWMSTYFNEEVFLHVCKEMRWIMKHPPKDYKDVVYQHFRRAGSVILRNCQARMADDSVSDGLKIPLRKLIPELSQDLKDLGANLDQQEAE